MPFIIHKCGLVNHDNPIRELNVSYDIARGMKSVKGEIEGTFLFF